MTQQERDVIVVGAGPVGLTTALGLHFYGLPWDTPWVLWGIGGYAFSGLLWLPAVWLLLFPA